MKEEVTNVAENATAVNETANNVAENATAVNETANNVAENATAVNETANNVAENATNEKTFADITAKVVNVTFDAKATAVTFNLDTTFISLDKEGKEKETNQFSMSLAKAVFQLSQFVEDIQLAASLAMSYQNLINPRILSLALANATIKVTREFVEEGTLNSYGKAYQNDTIINTFVNVKTNISTKCAQMINLLLTTQPEYKIAAPSANELSMSNNFGI